MSQRALKRRIRDLEENGTRLLSLLVDYTTVIQDLSRRGAISMAEYLQGMRNQIVLEQADNEIALVDARSSTHTTRSVS